MGSCRTLIGLTDRFRRKTEFCLLTEGGVEQTDNEIDRKSKPQEAPMNTGSKKKRCDK